MPHADSALVPPSIQTKQAFWEHVYVQLDALLSGQRHWICNLANAAALIYNSLQAFPRYSGMDTGTVNWCGFYISSSLYPTPSFKELSSAAEKNRLLLGPFCGKPACQFIDITPDKARGVCAGAFLQRQTVLVPDVEQYPGHIACDGDTKSEIVVPLILQQKKEEIGVGVMDLDCLIIDGFDEEDKLGLERIASLIVNACDW